MMNIFAFVVKEWGYCAIPLCSGLLGKDCVGNPCYHGSCEDGDDEYFCICSKGWKGKNCNQDINECNKSPCKNGGTCTNSYGSYSCKCQDGWTGNNCHEVYNCCKTWNCLDYRGMIAVTEEGDTCQDWGKDTVHSNSNNEPADHPEAGLIKNYCRNPDGSEKPWCYTLNPSKKWGYCTIPLCPALIPPTNTTLPTSTTASITPPTQAPTQSPSQAPTQAPTVAPTTVNPCEPNPCYNYGICRGDGKCLCKEYFEGDTCEIGRLQVEISFDGDYDALPTNQTALEELKTTFAVGIAASLEIEPKLA